MLQHTHILTVVTILYLGELNTYRLVCYIGDGDLEVVVSHYDSRVVLSWQACTPALCHGMRVYVRVDLAIRRYMGMGGGVVSAVTSRFQW